MQVTETKSEGLKREYSVTLPASAIEAKMAEKLDEARSSVQMKGFRKGKVPTALLRKMFGKSLLGEVVQESVDGAIREHFDSTGDRPATQPDVKITNEDFEEGQDINLALAYERLPDVPEADFSKIKLERLVAEVEDAAVNEALENLAKSAQNFDAKDGKAEDGDQVVIDFVGKIDGEAFEGGSAEDYPLVLGSNSFIPGFEEQLVGAKAGDDVEVKVAFPEEYGAEALAGKDAVFECAVKEVKAPVPAEIDDELAKKYGAEDLAGLKGQITDQLSREYASAARSLLKRKLLDAIDESVKFDLPESLVDAEANQIAHQLWHEEHPEEHGHDHDKIEPTDEHKTLAERRVRLGLLLAEVGRKNEIEVSENELNQEVFRQAQQYPGQERAFFEYVRNNEQMLQQLRAPIFEDKVVDFILELAEVSEKSVSKDDLQKALEALDEEDAA